MPDHAMRNLLSVLLFLSFAANGIACACPDAALAADDAGHANHGAETAQQESCHDCEADCSEVSGENAKPAGLKGLLARIAAETESDAQLAPPPPDACTRASKFSGPGGPEYRPCPITSDSPVSLYDRMLD